MNPRIIFSDFDGTLTHGSSLGPIFFEIIDHCESINSELIIVTGRSVSWAHFFLTHTKINTCISEGGGMISILDNGRIKSHPMVSQGEIDQLQKISVDLIKKFKGLELTADSAGRISDRAIELDDLKDEQFKKDVESFLSESGANFSCSSVHLNFWVGEVSKLKATGHFLENFTDNVDKKDVLYFGDAPNDESMFEGLPYTVGVSNIVPYLNEIKNHPSVILRGDNQRGPDGVLNHLKSFLK